MLTLTPACSVCGAAADLLDVVDLSKSCEEPRGKFLPLSGIPVYFARCGICGFCFAPEIMAWTKAEFERLIYNAGYQYVDPDYAETRPLANARSLLKMFQDRSAPIRHLDYGGGNGRLSLELVKSGWRSTSYDPFIDDAESREQLGKFNLITAFEVFEHVPNVRRLMNELTGLLQPDGVILFSTLISDGHIKPRERLSWWYASPRNGHISLFSKASLHLLAKHHGFTLASFSDGFHMLFIALPSWAKHLVSTQASAT
jgi:SAM-dependent methyltransferase